MLVWIIIYSTLFALATTWALVSIIERKETAYMQGGVSFTDAFLIGAFFLLFIYISNMIILIRWPRSAILYDLAVVTGLAGFGLYRETRYKLRGVFRRRSLREEALNLEWNIAKDPANAAYYERLSEVYEELGNKARALEAARAAEKIDPERMRNSWRIKHLEKDLSASARGQRRGKAP